MKRLYQLSLLLLLLSIKSVAQPAGTTNFYTGIKAYNLSGLWRADQLLLLSLKKYEAFPEPLGILGKNHQRFYIHYTTVTKDQSNPYVYHVQGKTRVGNQVRTFTGTLTVKQAGIFKAGSAYAPDTYKGYKRGKMICALAIDEDKKAPGAGVIRGELTTDFCIDSRNQLLYDTLDFGIDGYGNNQFTGNRTAYGNNVVQQLQFGDITITDSPFSDVDGITVPPEYEKYGWQNYVNAISDDNRPASKAAIAEERRQWWK
ncbi:hypothetical protein [Pedobacter duraquae]|uniref:Uncharacterized protein n=1 Tax=Pedobacter duraquae TaxID=425511 RepID=A0A4R6IBR6_9SPHI|nr:hypothetical protein [Pedobacter duraquae]TDO19046.1 hypothetical protein CLV32_4668 [Pedobacter duraquae]